jgi:flagellin-like protein
VNSQGGKEPKMKKLLKSKKALSPVVAAIILIAVTVAVSIAVAAWMGSLTFTFMETEQLQITSLDFNTAAGPVYTVTVHVQNTGTQDVTITSAQVTGNGVTGITPISSTTFDADGDVNSITITLSGSYSAGSAYNVKLLSSKGNTFSYTATA